MKEDVMNSRMVTYRGGDVGSWRVMSTHTIVGEPLAAVRRLEIIFGSTKQAALQPAWVVRGVASNGRYVSRAERNELVMVQPELGRNEATCGAFIPIKKSAAWWALTQDERRSILEEQSHHIKIGMRYLPAIARAIYHCRDLSEHAVFDFIAWFDFAPAHVLEFNSMLKELRATEEWKYVEREIDVRVERDSIA